METNEGKNCLGCSLIVCLLLILLVYLIVHVRITIV